MPTPRCEVSHYMLCGPRHGLSKEIREHDDAGNVLQSDGLAMHEGGSTMFTVELTNEQSCRFSDSDHTGSWALNPPWIIFEKPNALFGDSLYFSAKVQPPLDDDPKPRMRDGVVHRVLTASEEDQAPAADADGAVDGGAAPSDDDGSGDGGPLRGVGSFSAFLLDGRRDVGGGADAMLVDEAMLSDYVP